MSMNDGKPTSHKDLGRRRVPRRTFNAPVGVLVAGAYHVERTFQVGEGGMMLSFTASALEVGTKIVASFFLNSTATVIVRGVVRNVMAPSDGLPQRYGIEFSNLEFQHKREIRNFVASATHSEAV